MLQCSLWMSALTPERNHHQLHLSTTAQQNVHPGALQVSGQ
jgi:hypothetical protein